MDNFLEYIGFMLEDLTNSPENYETWFRDILALLVRFTVTHNKIGNHFWLPPSRNLSNTPNCFKTFLKTLSKRVFVSLATL